MTDSDRFAERLRTIMDEAQVPPPEQGWERISARLHRQRMARAFRAVSYAAACIAAAALLTFAFTEKDNPDMFRRESISGSYYGVLAYERPKPRFEGVISAARPDRAAETELTVQDKDVSTYNEPEPATGKGQGTDTYTEDLPAPEYRLDDGLDGTEHGSGHTKSSRSGRFSISASISPSTVREGSSSNAYPEKLFSSTYLKNEFEMTHELPVSYGVSVSYDLGGGFSIGSGINYTYYRSRYDNGAEDIRQTLHYLSVPLNVYYSILDSRWLRLYATGGASLDKCIKGNITSTVVKDGIERPLTKDIMEDNVQFSANLGAGVMLKATQFLSVFAEPQYVHYFNMGSRIQSYRTKYTDGFTVSVGLRFSF